MERIIRIPKALDIFAVMITISVCMIVKNESTILPRCLDSLKGLWDELVIVDTGSDDDTIEIAKRYTDKVYQYEWTGDFSQARNYALSKATCEYIYTADADEILEGDNYDKFLALKQCMDESIDVVQMYYGNQLENGTVYNYDKELRPKLFRRIKPILFYEPIHETLKIEPVIIDSEIVITHKPLHVHTTRDLGAFRKIIDSGERLSTRLQHFFARELYMADSDSLLAEFADYLYNVVIDPDRDTDEIAEACTLLVRHHRLRGEYTDMFDNVIKVMAIESNSELCVELGEYYCSLGRYEDAGIWYYNAAFECAPIMSIQAGKSVALNGLADTYQALGDTENSDYYRALSKEDETCE